ncbi:MAG: MmgE/PrpD family protein [Wenzhouxiangella sp.]
MTLPSVNGLDATSPSLADAFVDRLTALGAQVGPDHEVLARFRLLDTLGVAVAGARDAEGRLSSLSREMQPKPGAAKAIGLSGACDVLPAAMLNGISAHQLELDDGHRFGMVHPGTTVIAALLAVATAEPVDGKSLLRGIVVGYEAAIRSAMAMQPGLKQRGFHATGPCGTIGAAMGVAETLRLDRGQRRAALASAATMASGLLEVIRNGSDLKPFNAGQAAMKGLLAVYMARAGFGAPTDVMGGTQGFLQAFSDSPAPEKLVDIDPDHPMIEGVYVKPYAACRHCHAPIELMLRLRDRHNLRAEQIETVRVDTYGLAVHLHDHQQVVGSADARMSTPYSVAAALVTGEAGMTSFAHDLVHNPMIQRLMSRIVVREDPAMSARVPMERGARLTLALCDGRSLADDVSLPLGEPERPVRPEALQRKFHEMVDYAGWPQERAERTASFIETLDSDTGPLLDCIWPTSH